MFFRDRRHAGVLLTERLHSYKHRKHTVVIALPRGGVPVAYEIAKGLDLPLDVTCPHKIGAPFNSEYAIGAITERGDGIYNEHEIKRLHVSKEYLAHETSARVQEAKRQLELYRNDPTPRTVKDETVILVDDGLATGFTMKAAIRSMQDEGAKKIVVAVPVSPPETLKEVGQLVQEIVCLEAPPFFAAVGQFYDDFSQTTDDEVIDLLRQACSLG